MNLPEENPSLELGLGLGGSPLHAEIDPTKGISVPLGKQPQPPGSSSRVEVALDRQGNSKGKSQHDGLKATDPLGNSPVPVPLPLLPGELNYQECDTRGVHSQSLPQEMQRFPNNNDGFSRSPWEEILSLVNAPSSSSLVPEIGMGNTSIRHISVPDSYSQGNNSHFTPQTPATGPLGSGETSGMLSTWNLDAASTKHLVPTLYSQGDSLGSTLRQSIMAAPPQPVDSQNELLIDNSHEYGYDMSNSLSPEVSNLILSDVTSSVQLSQGYCLASDRWSSSTCFPHTQQDGFPAPYFQQPRYTPNYTIDNSSPSISSHCFYFAPATPQAAEKSGSQLNLATLNLSMDQNLNRGKVQQQNLPASPTIRYYSQLTPPLVQSLKTYENHHQDLAVLNLPLNQEIGQGNCQQQAFGSCTKNNSVYHDCQEVIQNIVNSSSAALGTPQKESISEIGVNRNIDLNKTPAQKPPKRRKHRPKVIVENKTPKNRRPACPKAATEGVKVEKRKYERKNRPNSVDALQSEIEEDNASYIEPVSKTCRRVLNFDQDNDVLIGSKFINQPGMKCLGKANTSENSNAQETGCSIDNFALQNSQPKKQKGNEVGTISSSHLTNCEMQDVSSPVHGQKGPATHTMLRNMTSELPYISTSDLTYRSVDPCQSTKGIRCISTNPPIYGEMGHPVTQMRLATAKKQITKSIAPEKQQQVHEYWYPIGPAKVLSQNPDHESGCFASTNFTSSLLLCQEIFQNKRKKVLRESPRTGTSMQFSANQEGANQNQRNGQLLNHIAKVNDGQLNSYQKGSTAVYPCTGPSNSMNMWQSHLTSAGRNIMKQQNKVGVCLGPNNVVENREKPSIASHILKSLNGGADTKMLQQEPFNKASGAEWLVNGATIGITGSTMQLKKQNGVPLIPMLPSNSTGPDQKQKKMISVEDVIDLLGCLSLNTTKQKQKNALVPYKADGSVVPYQGFEPLRRRRARPKVDLDQETMRLWKVLMRQDVTDDDSKTDEEKEKWWEEERKVFRGRADSFIARMHLVQGDRRFSPWKGSVVDSVIGVFLTQNVSDHLSSSAFMSLAARFPVQSTKTATSLSDGPVMIVEEPEVCMLTTNERLPRHDSLSKGIYTRTCGESSQQERHDMPSASSIEQLTGAISWRSEEFVSLQDSSESPNVLATEGIQSSESSSREHYHTNCGNFNNELLASNDEEMNNTIKLPEINCVSGKLFYEASTRGHWQFQDAVRTSKQKQPDGVDNISSFSTIIHSFDLNCPDVQLPAISFSNDQLHLASGLESHRTDSLHTLKPQPSIYLHSRASEVTLVDDDVAAIEQISQETILFQNRQAQPQGPPPENPFATCDKRTVDMRNLMPQGVESCCHLYSGGIHPQDITMSSLFGINAAKDPFHTQIDTVQAPGSSQDHAEQRSSVDLSILGVEKREYIRKTLESNTKEQICPSSETCSKIKKNEPKAKGKKPEGKKKTTFDWDTLRKQAESTNGRKGRSKDTTDSIDYKTLLHANVKDISEAIRERGMNNMLAERMKDFLNRVVRDHGSIDLEWLRDITPDRAKDYLLSIQGLGLKSVECIRLLTLHQHAFPVDTNVGRIAVRLGWVPLQPLPESLQLHLLELYPVLESIQKYLWPRLCNLDQRTLYELHYQLITFGKVFCTKSKPNCNACPMRAECRHFASAFASSRLALPGQEDKSIVISDIPIKATKNPTTAFNPVLLHSSEIVQTKETSSEQKSCEPIVEEPSTPEPEVTEILETDIEDFDEDPDEIPTIRLNVEEFAVNLQNFMQENMELQEGDMSRALVALDSKAASIPMPKLKNVNRLRTEHQVYQLPDTHPLLKELDVREPDDPSPYLLAIWTPGETSNSIQPPEERCASQEAGNLCSDNTCFICNSIREANSQTVRGTLLIPCRTAMRGSFPLNGTYFQVNEVFADHESSLNPIDVPRLWIWNLPRRTVYFGTSVTTIFKGMSTEEIQYCFWRGFVCVRGFDLQTRAPRPLTARLHFPASKQVKLSKRRPEAVQTS